MSTKGPSGKYDGTKGSTFKSETKNISYPWAKAFAKSKLKKHFENHCKEFNASTKEEYEAKAVRFANNIDRVKNISFVTKKDKKTYKYNEESNVLVIVRKDGIIETFFKPKKGKAYYNNEKRKKNKI